MTLKLFSPLYWLVTLALVVFLLGGNYLYVSFFLNRAEPAAKAATETQLGVEIERNIRGLWTVPAESLHAYPGNGALLQIKVFTANLVLLLVFVAGFLLEFLLIYIVAIHLFKGSM